MTVREVWNRGNNLLAIAFLAISGLAFFPDYLHEDKFINRLDEELLLALGIMGIGWYVRGKNKFSRSIVPVALLFLGLVFKILAIILEFSQKEEVGDEVGGITLYALATLVVLWFYIKANSSKES